MIAVTGAGGKTGLSIIQMLARRGVHVRGLVHKEADREKVIAAGRIEEDIEGGIKENVEAVVGDVADAATVEKVLDGASALYHICPNMHPNEVAIGTTVLQCARAAGVQHFVYHSVLHPQAAAMPHHWQKMLVEDLLFQSGIPFTILQPTAYMQNLLANWPMIQQTGHYTVPYPMTTRLALVDLADVAEVAGRVLTEPGHLGATYELVGTRPLSQVEVAEVMSAQMGQGVTAQELPLDQWEQQARASALNDYAVQTLLQMFRYYAAYGLVGNPNVLRWLLGRAPISLEEFIGESVKLKARS